MNVAIVGFGKMGKEILGVLENKDATVVSIIDPFSQDNRVTGKKLSTENLNCADVVIDFSSPSTILENIDFYISNNLRAVIGTTGWNSSIPEIRAKMEKSKAKVLYSGNYSIGVALFLKIVDEASSLIGKTGLYDEALFESHHNAKADSPSGTALMLANAVLKNSPEKKRLLIGNSEKKIEKDELQVISLRVGYEPGLHEVVFDSEADTIKLTHHARSRKGFATGAVKAAFWLCQTDKSGLLEMDDFINELLGRR